MSIKIDNIIQPEGENFEYSGEKVTEDRICHKVKKEGDSK